MYELDAYTMNDCGLEGRVLMENAGRAMANHISSSYPTTQPMLVLAGKGNNGGDGFVIARVLAQRGFQVSVLLCQSPERISGDAAYHLSLLQALDVSIHEWESKETLIELSKGQPIFIDAMLGLGIKGEVREPYRTIITLLNDWNQSILAVDVPSGLPADEGVDVDLAIKATRTYTIHFPKVSAFLQQTAPYYGERVEVDIGLFQKPDMPVRNLWGEKEVRQTLPERSPFAHKGTFGKGLVVGGSVPMPGSVAMTARAALRSGAGLLTVATTKESIPAISPLVTEATFVPLEQKDGFINELKDLDFDSYDGVAFGMGLGTHEEAQQLLTRALRSTEGPLVIDADGLTALVNVLHELKERSAPTILTPHPGEMARLLDVSVADLLKQPFRYVRQFAVENGVSVILKGAFTIVTDQSGQQWVTTTGNQALAKGGSGDVLTGIVLTMLMQDQPLYAALNNACFIHGRAADLLVEEKHSHYDLLATDLIEGIGRVIRTRS